MIVKDKPVGRALLLQWMIVNALAWGMVMITFFAMTNRTYDIIGALIPGAITGFAFGIVQWFSLRWWVYRSSWWILVSAIGGAVALAIGGKYGQVMGLTIFGFSVGLAQWLLLQRWVHYSGWWIVISGLSGFIGGTIGVLAGDWIQAAGFMVGGVVFGAITGGTLVWLLKHPR
jgi:hypothetical protein